MMVVVMVWWLVLTFVATCVVVVVVVVDGGEGGLRVVGWGCVGLFRTCHGDMCCRHNIFLILIAYGQLAQLVTTSLYSYRKVPSSTPAESICFRL